VEIVGTLTPWLPGGLIADSEDLLGRRIAVATENELHSVVRGYVLREAVPL
jgi:predicted nucleotidyltransferase